MAVTFFINWDVYTGAPSILEYLDTGIVHKQYPYLKCAETETLETEEQ